MKTPTPLYSRLALITSVTLITGYLIVSAVWVPMSSVWTGDQLAATLWNTFVGNLNDLDTRLKSTASTWPTVTGGIAYTGGNVGIGTVSPLRAFHVKSAVGTAQIESTGTISNLYFGDTTSSVIDNQGIGSRGNNIAIMAGGYDKLMVLSTGNVWIGTTNPGEYRTAIRGSTDDNTASALWVSGASSLTGALVVRNDGNVGIGTATPGVKLEIKGTEPEILTTGGFWPKGTLQITDNGPYDGGTGPTITFYKERDVDHNQVVVGAISGGGIYPNQQLQFWGKSNGVNTLGTIPSMVIQNNGNVGIGTTAPQTSVHLERSGTTDLLLKDSSQAVNQKSWLIRNSVASFKIGRVDDAFTTLLPSFVIANDGNIGIGTAGPGGKLVVIGAGTTSGTYGLNVTKSDGTSNLFVRDDGNVGIGTTTPVNKLDINWYASATRLIAGNNVIIAANSIALGDGASTTAGGQIRSIEDGSTLGLRFMNYAANTEWMRIQNGNVGIGTTNPTEKLQVNSSMKLYYSDAESMKIWMVGGAVTWGIQVTDTGDGGNGLLLNPNGGNVGIGTTDPLTYKLYINGNWYLGAAAWVYSSDRRLKENITPLKYGIKEIMKLDAKKFDYIKGEKNNLGFIAQDVQSVLPELVTTQPSGMLWLKTDMIIPVLVKAMQELKKENDELKSLVCLDHPTAPVCK